MRNSILLLLSLCAIAAGDRNANALAQCVGGQCPATTTPGRQAENIQVDARSIVRVFNTQGASRTLGTGTLVEADDKQGLVITCAHLFRDGAGSIVVAFPDGRGFAARLVKIDASADLAALLIASPGVRAVAIADDVPRQGEPLVSCGYGQDGRLWCNQGQALGYVSASGQRGAETLEMSGAARMGDSGGPVFNRRHQLVAVLFGTNGRVVDGTFCGRIRRFLADLAPRNRTRPPAAPVMPNIGPLDGTPLVDVHPEKESPSPAGPSLQPESQPDSHAARIVRLEEVVARIQHAWQALSAKFDGLSAKLDRVRADVSNKAIRPPEVELPPGVDSGSIPGALQTVAEPWITAKVVALLVSVGVPGGFAAAAGGAAVWFVMRRGKRKLSDKLRQLQTNRGAAAPAATEASASTGDPPTIERHHNRYVPYEVSALDKAWAAAHAHVGEKYPGAVPYLKIAEGVKDQLLSGTSDPQIS